MLDYFKRFRRQSEQNPAAQQLIVTPSGSTSIPEDIRAASAFRRREIAHRGQGPQHPKRGMWVVSENDVGILTKIEKGDVCTVMLVDQIGLNLLEIHVPANTIRQAWYEEIPEARRPKYDAAANLGYLQMPRSKGAHR